MKQFKLFQPVQVRDNNNQDWHDMIFIKDLGEDIISRYMVIDQENYDNVTTGRDIVGACSYRQIRDFDGNIDLKNIAKERGESYTDIKDLFDFFDNCRSNFEDIKGFQDWIMLYDNGKISLDENLNWYIE